MKYIIFVAAIVISGSLYCFIPRQDTYVAPQFIAAGTVTKIGQRVSSSAISPDVANGPYRAIEIDGSEVYYVPSRMCTVFVGDACKILADRYGNIILR